MHIFYSLHSHACSGEGKDLMRMGLALAVLTLPHTLHLKEHWKPLTLEWTHIEVSQCTHTIWGFLIRYKSTRWLFSSGCPGCEQSCWIKDLLNLGVERSFSIASVFSTCSSGPSQSVTVSISQFIFPSSLRRNPVQTKQCTIYRKLGRVKKWLWNQSLVKTHTVSALM